MSYNSIIQSLWVTDERLRAISIFFLQVYYILFFTQLAVVIFGDPGVGKTRLSRNICKCLKKEKNWRIMTVDMR